MPTLEEQVVDPAVSKYVDYVMLVGRVDFDNTGAVVRSSIEAYFKVAGELEKRVNIVDELNSTQKTALRSIIKGIRDRVTTIKNL